MRILLTFLIGFFWFAAYAQPATPVRSLGFPPDSSNIYFAATDTSSSSVTYGRGLYRSLDWLIGVMRDSVTGATVGGGIYGPTTGDTINGNPHTVVIPQGSSLDFHMDGDEGSGAAQMRFIDSTGAGANKMELEVTGSGAWRWSSYFGGILSGYYETGKVSEWYTSSTGSATITTGNAAIDASSGVEVFGNDTTDGLLINSLIGGGAIGELTNTSGLLNDGQTHIAAGLNGVTLNSQNGYWFKNPSLTSSEVVLPSSDNTHEDILVVDDATGQWHLRDQATLTGDTSILATQYWVETNITGGGGGGVNIYNADSTVTTNRTVTLTDSLMFDFNDGGKFELGYDIAGTQNIRIWESGTSAPAYIYWQNSTTGTTFQDGAYIGMDNDEELELWSENRVHLISDVEFGNDIYDVNREHGTNGQVLVSLGGAGVEWQDISGVPGVGVYAQENNGTAVQVDTLDFQTGIDVTFGSGDADITLDPSEFNIVTADTAADYFVISDASDFGRGKRVDVAEFKDFVSSVTLDGTTLRFNGTGDATDDNVDLSSLQTTDTYAEVQYNGIIQNDAAPVLDFNTSDFNIVESPNNDFDIQLEDEAIEDIVGGMVTGNTETGITVTYQDVDGTIDFIATDQSATNEAWTITADNAASEVIANETVDFVGGTDISTSYNATTNEMTINYTGSGGGGVDVEDAGLTVTTGASAINFQTGFDVTNSSGTANITHAWDEFPTTASVESDDYFMFHDSGSGNIERASRATVQTWIESFAGGSGEWTRSGSSVYTNNTTDNVGIGTDVGVDALLHVEEKSSGADLVVKLEETGATGGEDVEIQFFSDNQQGRIEYQGTSTDAVGESEFQFWSDGEEILTLKSDPTNWSASDALMDVQAGYANSNWIDMNGTTTLDLGHYGIVATTSGITITMPSIPANYRGNEYIIYNNSGGNITLDPGGSGDNFNGSTANITLADNESLRIVNADTDGFGATDWITFN